ncbi:ATP-binding cassette domain-containing protein [Cronobacter turicensis]|nr:ATP-binding cassette domain-containing protein [Cronobacter turicensis]ELU8456202.1 ATP-binding cassette domain-containing protein [Cronobacter turicensis]ELY4109923.1 ATP-binding cassette domain-containing protein [Cronobacter turicensis]ELY4214646.1 ATP-binding cassette domain-containing protein [Cronobacter turicensis]EMA1790918.1 ATP-binding cassette domain-containing protein [Cronobacter turicensis]
MLSLHAVNHFYGTQHTLWDVSLDLLPGECTCVIGAPGMGKTTLLNCVAGYLPVKSGSMLWREAGQAPQELMRVGAEARAALGIRYVPQARRYFSQLTVEENLHIALRAQPETAASPEPVFDLFPTLWTRRHAQASGLAPELALQLTLAQALVTRPRLLILDEPTRGLGQMFIPKLADLLTRLNREWGMSLLLVEQHLSFIRRVADRFCLLHRGRAVARGSVAQLTDARLMHWITP